MFRYAHQNTLITQYSDLTSGFISNGNKITHVPIYLNIHNIQEVKIS